MFPENLPTMRKSVILITFINAGIHYSIKIHIVLPCHCDSGLGLDSPDLCSRSGHQWQPRLWPTLCLTCWALATLFLCRLLAFLTLRASLILFKTSSQFFSMGLSLKRRSYDTAEFICSLTLPVAVAAGKHYSGQQQCPVIKIKHRK